MELAGVEALTIELDGSVPVAAARALAGPRIDLDARDGRASVSLLLFRMRGLRPVGVGWPFGAPGRAPHGAPFAPIPGPAFDYDEALWRVGVRHEGLPAWLVVACDLDSVAIRVAGRWLVRYPARRAAFEMARDGERWRARVDAAGASIAVSAAELPASPPPAPPRRVIARSGGALHEIPWREDPAPHRREADVTVPLDSLGEVTFGARVDWAPRGLVHTGRVHRCGVARRLA